MTERSNEVTVAELAAMFESALGAEKAGELVADHFRRAGLSGTTCTMQQALDVLDRIGKTEGIAAVVARFAKARMLLRRTG